MHTRSTYMEPFERHKIGIVGLGLIGGSFAKALSSTNDLYLFDINAHTQQTALESLHAHALTEDTLKDCDLLILASYPAANIDYIHKCAHLLSDNALVIDTAGVKRDICADIFALARTYQWNFIGCHPMAGTQYSGFKHARASMFYASPMVVVTDDDALDATTKQQLLKHLKMFLEPCGFKSFCTATAAFHDQQIAYTSQLAHVVSNAYVKSPQAQAHKGFSAGSYKDLTRVARLNKDMWCELFLANRDNLSHEIGLLIEELAQYKEALDTHDATRLTELLAEGDALKRKAELQS